ncbi:MULTISPECIES: hypothetical protein [Terrabacteria group]|uniref:hypothetical protein n=1 Tax=Bacillati TaxID=1783272 RepID=UPI0019393B28|nr:MULTISPECIES: hypothetical protein [Terrabacteria group]MBW9213191.1 hypothetical protein [Trueperella sp. zg.1013]QRG86921.1 hypothetical protein JOS54_00980 [Bulleidia sp. zg-1006]
MDFTKLEETIELDISRLEQFEKENSLFKYLGLASHFSSLKYKVNRNLVNSFTQKKLVIHYLKTAGKKELIQLVNDLQNEKRLKVTLKDLENKQIGDELMNGILELITKNQLV